MSGQTDIEWIETSFGDWPSRSRVPRAAFRCSCCNAFVAR